MLSEGTQFAQNHNIHNYIYQRQKLTLRTLYYGCIILLLEDTSMFMIILIFQVQNRKQKPYKMTHQLLCYSVVLVGHQQENHQGCNI